MVNVDLDDVSNCPVARVCEACGKAGRNRRVRTVGSQVGIGCITLCAQCGKDNPPPMPVVTAVTAVMEHCEHLGITVDEMAALVDAEEAQSDEQYGKGRRKR